MRRAWLIPVVSLAACKYGALPPLEGIDGALANDANESDGNADGAPAFAFVPLHLQQAELLPGAPDVVLSAPTTIDTSSLTIAGATSSFFVQQNNNAVLYTHGFDAQSTVTITGSFPLIVVATGSIHIEADLNLGAVGSVSGPGAVNTGEGGVGGTFTPGPITERSSSGGGGGGYGISGAAGGQTGGTAGVAGGKYGMDVTGPLAGGSPGGAGGFATVAGGGGGGALQLTSEVSIVVASITINAGGGGGPGGTAFAGGGGGGAGGELLLESPMLTITGALAANGGGGGGGGSGGSIPGTAGSDATAVFQAAGGGPGTAPEGSNGGPGAYNFSAAVADQPGAGSNNNSMAGGGGGGQGVIWLRYPAGVTPDLTGARFSPAAQTVVLPL